MIFTRTFRWLFLLKPLMPAPIRFVDRGFGANVRADGHHLRVE